MNLLMRPISAVTSQKIAIRCERRRLSSVARLLPLLALLMFSAVANAQTTSGTTADGLKYTTANDQVTITGYSGTGGAVSISGTINGLPVTSIGDSAFDFCKSLTSVTIPNSVTSIGNKAFDYTSLTSVVIPSSVTSIGYWAFGGSNLRSVTIPSSVNSIGYTAFGYCSSLTNVTIAGNVTNFGINMFLGCGSLTSVIISGSVTSIGTSAFENCYKLTNITIPNGVTSIGDCAFQNCYKLISIAIPSSVTSIGYCAFKDCDSLTSIAIPSSVTSIDTAAFEYCSGLTSITIPASVTHIGLTAFRSSGLTSILVDTSNSFYSSVDGILFSKNLTTLIQYPGGKVGEYTVPNSVTSIGAFAFASCMKLTSITIPNSVTNIGDSAFYYTGLTSVMIPNSVTGIGNYAFAYCSSLKSAVFIGNASAMGSSAFWSADSSFEVDYYNGAGGFTSPTWKGYKAVNIGASPLASWLLFKGFPSNADLRSDPKGCGVNLLMAYALNLDPAQSQCRNLPRPVVSADQMSLTYYAGSEGITYSVESSTDLQTWSTTDVTVSAPDANNLCTATVPATGPRRFMRLVVTR